MSKKKNQTNIAGKAKEQTTNIPTKNEKNSSEKIEFLKLEIESIFTNKSNDLFQKLNFELSNKENKNRIARNEEIQEKIPQIEMKILKNIDDFCLFFENHADYVTFKER